MILGRARISSWLSPRLGDCLFLAVVCWLIFFTLSGGPTGLLIDTDTGSHIRVGDFIRAHHAIPTQDFFSYTRPGTRWLDYEWLTQVQFSWLYQAGGFKALIVFSAALIALGLIVLLAHLASITNALVALLLLHLAMGACSIHYLARPHLFTLLFVAIAGSILAKDRLAPSRFVWIIVPLTILWVNVHGGFLAIIVITGALAVGSGVECLFDRETAAAKRKAAIRYATLCIACLLAAGINPAGFYEHYYMARYFQQKWVVDLVKEYQSPIFHTPESRYAELLIFAALATAGLLLSRKQIASALLILGWTHSALVSARHIPILAIVATPFIAAEVNRLWEMFTAGKDRRSIAGILRGIAEDHRTGVGRLSVWTPVSLTLLLLVPLGIAWPTDFPASIYPVAMVSRHADTLPGSRVFSTDGWNSYLEFHFYPSQRIFIDGRSDTLGETVVQEYGQLLNGGEDWHKILDRYGIDTVMAPRGSAIGSLLKERTDWKLIDQDEMAFFFKKN